MVQQEVPESVQRVSDVPCKADGPPRRVAHAAIFHRAMDVRIFQKECRSLTRAGYDVHLIVPDPPYRQLDSVEFHNIRRLDRGIPILSVLRRVAAVAGVLCRIRPSIFHFHEPHLLPAALVARIAGVKTVYDVHEDFPRQMLSAARSGAGCCSAWGRVQAGIVGALEWISRAWIDGYACATPTIADRFPPARTVLVRNFILEEEARQLGDGVDGQPYARREPLAAYVGGLNQRRGICEVVEAVGLVQNTVRLALGGTFDRSEYRGQCEASPGWEKVDNLGLLDRRGVIDLLSRARVGVATLLPTPEYVLSLPVKIFEYMAAGLPIVASDFPLWRELFAPIGCCRFVDPADPRSIAEAIDAILGDPVEAEEMGRRGLEAVRTKFSWAGEETTLVDLYCRLHAPPSC